MPPPRAACDLGEAAPAEDGGSGCRAELEWVPPFVGDVGGRRADWAPLGGAAPESETVRALCVAANPTTASPGMDMEKAVSELLIKVRLRLWNHE